MHAAGTRGVAWQASRAFQMPQKHKPIKFAAPRRALVKVSVVVIGSILVSTHHGCQFES